MIDEPILVTRRLSVSFGAVRAVDCVTLECGEQLTGLIGPNGAGKTTLIDAITGFVPSMGTVIFNGREVSGWRPHRLARFGLRRTWQTGELFDDLSVRSNLEVACDTLSVRGVLKELVGSRSTSYAVEWAADIVGMRAYLDSSPRDLSQGERKLLSLARSLVASPTYLLLDEPAAGLDRSETAWLGERLRRIVESVPILLVDHDMSLVLTVCDLVHVLQSGRLIATGSPTEIRSNPEVVSAYLGSSERGS